MKPPSITQGQFEKAASGWYRGLNSVRNPWLLDDAMYPWSVNTVNRGGIVQTRPGYLLALTLPPGNLQGFEVMTISKLDQNGNVFQGGKQFLIAAVDGKVYASSFPLTQPVDWNSRRLANIQFNPDAKRVIFCQAQKSVNTANGNISLTTTYSVMIMQDGVGPAAYWDGAINGHVSEDQPAYSVPAGTWMAYSGNRLWVARDNALLASDLLDPLSFLERINGVGRGDFLLPSSITGMINTIGFTFQTNLIVFTIDQTFSFLSYIANRETWSSTPNFQTTLYPSLGCVAGLSIVNHAGLLWWYSSGGLVSSNSATTAYLSSRIKYQDVEMAFITAKMYEDMSGICACSYESYLMMSIPSEDVFNSKTMVMDYAIADELTSQEAPAWQSAWTGTRPVKWVTAKIAAANGAKKAYQASVDYELLNGSHNHIWEAFQNDRTDSYEFLNSSNDLELVHNPIYCSFETKLEGDGLDLKVFKYALVNICELSGEVFLKVSYRGTQGGYKEILNAKFIAITEAWQTTSQEIINLINSGTILVPQNRKLRTQTAKSLDQELEQSVESDKDETIDKCFSLHIQWCGRAAVESFLMITEPYPEKVVGECTADEVTLNIVTEDGNSKRYLSDSQGSVAIVAPPAPAPNFDNQLFNRPFTPRYRDVYYSSVPPQQTNSSKECVTCLPCSGDNYPPVVFDPTENDVDNSGGGPIVYVGNTVQTYTATCPSGSVGDPFTFITPKDYFFATTQTAADLIAYNYAIQEANQKIVCVSHIPVVTSDTMTIAPSTPINYQIVATNTPTSYGATNLPIGLNIDHSSGIISGTITSTASTTYTIGISATNIYGTGSGTLTITVSVQVSFSIAFTAGTFTAVEVSIDGNPYAAASATTYTAFHQFKYRTTHPSATNLTSFMQVTCTISSSGSVTLLSGSQLHAEYNVLSLPPSSSPQVISSLNSFQAQPPQALGMQSATTIIGGQTINGTAYHLADKTTGAATSVDSILMESIFNF